MTENKRFSIRSYDGINCHIFDRSIVIAEVDRRDINNLCNLLNELNDENEQLKQENKELTISLNCERKRHLKTHNENEDLESQLKYLRKLSNTLFREMKE